MLCRTPTHVIHHSAAGLVACVLRHVRLCDIPGFIWRARTMSDAQFREVFGNPNLDGLAYELRAVSSGAPATLSPSET